MEATWRASEGLVGLRPPDVSARCGDHRTALEVQLSATFLDVVLGRKRFYHDECAVLVWISPSFDPRYAPRAANDFRRSRFVGAPETRPTVENQLRYSHSACLTRGDCLMRSLRMAAWCRRNSGGHSRALTPIVGVTVTPVALHVYHRITGAGTCRPQGGLGL